MNKFFVLLVPALLATAVSAQEVRLAVIKQIGGIELLNQVLMRQIETSTLRVVSQQPGIELLLSGSSGAPDMTNIDAVAVEGEILKGSAGYRVEARLIDLKTKKLIGKASVDRIREEDLLRIYEGALQLAFEPFTKSRKQKKMPTPELKNFSPAKQPLSSKNLPSTLQVAAPDETAIDFRELVRGLKSSVDKGVAKVSADRIAEKSKQANESEVQSKSLAESRSGESSLTAGTSRSELPKLMPEATKAGHLQRHRLSLGYNTREIFSSFYVDSTVTASFLNLRADGRIPLLLKGRLGASYDLAVNRSMAVPAELPTLWHAGGFLSYLGDYVVIDGGFLRDTNFFMNLPAPGEGIVPKTIVTTHLLGRIELNFRLLGPWRIEGFYGVPMSVETNFSPLKKSTSWSGSYTRMAVTPPVSFLGIETNFAIERIALNSQGDNLFKLTDSRFAFSLQRSL